LEEANFYKFDKVPAYLSPVLGVHANMGDLDKAAVMLEDMKSKWSILITFK
jgi:pentatricopeptide repeat protein